MGKYKIHIPPIVGGYFRVGRKLGQGAFGCVHLGKTIPGDMCVALKFELKQDGVVRTLFHEKEIYNRLRGITGVALAIAVEELQNVDLLVLPYIGPSLADLAKARPLSLDELCHIGAKTLRTLYHIHSAGVLHGDIKHNNILCCQKTGEIFMTDYGCSGLTTDQAPMGGTFAYLSRNAHNHINATTDDDVESWYYMIFRLTKSYLPWDDLVDKNMDCPEVINALLKRKVDFWDNHEFAQVLPSPLNEIFMEFNHWQNNDNPFETTTFNYERIITILEGSATKGPLDLSAVTIDTNFTVDQVFRTLVFDDGYDDDFITDLFEVNPETAAAIEQLLKLKKTTEITHQTQLTHAMKFDIRPANSTPTSSALANTADLASSCEGSVAAPNASLEFILSRLAPCAAEVSPIEVNDNPGDHEKSNKAICLPPVGPRYPESHKYPVLRKTVFPQFIHQWLNIAFFDAQLIGESYKNPRYIDPFYMPSAKYTLTYVRHFNGRLRFVVIWSEFYESEYYYHITGKSAQKALTGCPSNDENALPTSDGIDPPGASPSTCSLTTESLNSRRSWESGYDSQRATPPQQLKMWNSARSNSEYSNANNHITTDGLSSEKEKKKKFPKIKLSTIGKVSKKIQNFFGKF